MYLLQKIYKVYSPVNQSSGFQVVPTHLKQKKNLITGKGYLKLESTHFYIQDAPIVAELLLNSIKGKGGKIHSLCAALYTQFSYLQLFYKIYIMKTFRQPLINIFISIFYS